MWTGTVLVAWTGTSEEEKATKGRNRGRRIKSEGVVLAGREDPYSLLVL